jgi:WS/DGAT/MGAT family acyltransferase
MQQLTGLDASMLYMETPETPNHVAAFTTYDPSTAPGGTVSFEAILANVESRLGLSRTFRRKMVGVPFGLDHPYWIEDGDFDLEYHVRRVAAPAPGSWRQLCALVAELYAQPLDLRRPPWELYVIEGLGDGVDGIPANGFATLLKIHHAAVDGVSGMELVTVLNDHRPDATPPAVTDTWEPESPPNPFDLVRLAGWNTLLKPMHAVRVAARLTPGLVRVPIGLGRGTLEPPPNVPRTRFNTPVTTQRSVDALRAPVEDVKRTRTAVPGATVNDAVLTIVGGALRLYLEGKGELPDESMVALVPISTRSVSSAGTGGNQIAMATATLATTEPDPVKRLALVSASMVKVKEMANVVGGRALADLSDAVPGMLLGLGSRALSRISARNQGQLLATTAVTNVPGPSEPLYFTGARVVGPYGAGPIRHGLGLIHTVGSYVGQFTFSFTADREMMPDPDHYVACLSESLDELLAAAEPAPTARRPASGGARSRKRAPSPRPVPAARRN